MREAGFRELGVDLSNVRGNATTCPKCSESRKGRHKTQRCLSVNLESGNVNCNHCGWKARAHTNEFLNKEEYKPVIKKTNIKPFQTSPVTKEGMDYLRSRGISEDTVRETMIAQKDGVICFNYYDGKNIVAAKYRKIKEKFFWQHAGVEPTLYKLNDIKTTDVAIICEGEFDALSWHEAGKKCSVSVNQGAPNPGDENADAKLKCLDTCERYLKKKKKIYISVDNDEPGKRLEFELARRFGKSRCFIVRYPEGCKDANDVLVKHGKDKLIECFDNAKPIPVDGIITVDDVSESMKDQFLNGVPKGETTHFPALDGTISWLKGDLYAWTGLPNHGKSEIFKFLMVLKSLNDGWKWAIFSPEHAPAEDYYMELVEVIVGKSTDKDSMDYMSMEEFEMAMDWMKRYFFFIYPEETDNVSAEDSMHSPDIIREKIKYLVLTKGIDGYLIDPWNQLMHTGMESREDLYLALELGVFDKLNKEHDLVGNIVAHPKAIPPNKDGMIREPTGYDISGGPMWMNKIYNLMITHRPMWQEDKRDPSVTLNVFKVKKQKRVGIPDKIDLEYDRNTGWYAALGENSPMKGLFHNLFFSKPLPGQKQIVSLPDHEMMKRANSVNEDDVPF